MNKKRNLVKLCGKGGLSSPKEKYFSLISGEMYSSTAVVYAQMPPSPYFFEGKVTAKRYMSVQTHDIHTCTTHKEKKLKSWLFVVLPFSSEFALDRLDTPRDPSPTDPPSDKGEGEKTFTAMAGIPFPPFPTTR